MFLPSTSGAGVIAWSFYGSESPSDCNEHTRRLAPCLVAACVSRIDTLLLLRRGLQDQLPAALNAAEMPAHSYDAPEICHVGV